jgi:CHAT domain-containing protein|tara:strand:- start:115 stop:549 length:435 start_codon:yes stop_codon:yes gene_type:complete
MDIKDELFKGTSFADLMSDVYHNSKKKDRQINQLISQLQPLIRNASDATIIVPLIKEYLDVAVKNDDHLVKLTAITQRYISTTQTISGESSLLSDDEKKELLEMASKDFEDELSEEIEKIDNEDKILQEKISKVKESLEKNNDT